MSARHSLPGLINHDSTRGGRDAAIDSIDGAGRNSSRGSMPYCSNNIRTLDSSSRSCSTGIHSSLGRNTRRQN